MHRPTATLAILLTLTITAAGAHQTETLTGTWTMEAAESRRAGADGQPRLHLLLRTEPDQGRTHMGVTVPVASFSGLPASLASVPDARFELRRDAGTFRFEGQFRDGRGIGEFRFDPDGAFAQVLAARGESDPSSRRLFSLAALDVSRAFIQEVEQAFPGIALKDVVSFRIHGVTAAFRAELRQRGFSDLSPNDLVKARIHGVTPAYVDEMRQAGFPGEDLDGLVRLRIHGVSERYIKEMAAAGYTGLSARELREARIHGVRPEFVRAVQEAGYTGVPLRDLVKMRIHGVTPAFITSLGEAGYRDLTIEQLVRFRIHGVNAKFIEDLKADGYRAVAAGAGGHPDPCAPLATPARERVRGKG
ncbi:MAG: 4-hydroxy-3-methylbut-2-enyl diphosphate reductase [Acidobacteria bacterium]|nr:4-hydroxy-3-methylbut-2-enyl diphosphate reductase [Acidobacteriota bacterium]